MDKVAYYQSQLDKELAQYPLAKKVEEQTGIPKVYAFLGVVSLILLLIFFNIGAGLITNLVGFIYPAYASLKALEGKQEQTQWISYWLLFGLFSVLEFFSDVMLKWFPFFYVFKVIFLAYAFLPQTLGATVVYERLLHPVFQQWTSGPAKKTG
ncbi:hypothetical protein MP638_006556 [Amoeboaphelidium occidentale]|nr:hypothetical protein MP638_006556 [Amoeboaphelidium occidentale]